MPVGIRADYVRLAELLMEFGADLRLLFLAQWEVGYSNYALKEKRE